MLNSAASFSEHDVQKMLDNLDNFSEDEIEEIWRIVDELDARKAATRAQNDLISFCLALMPDYIVGKHHRLLANELMDIECNKKDRLCVNIPPRHGKSQLVSIMYPAWFLGRNPNAKVMMVSHTTDLAVDFGRKVRNLVDSEAYKQIFPMVELSKDNKSAGRWNTNRGGEFFACGVGSALAGRGADLLLIDDPHSEQDVLNGNFEVFDRAYEWYAYGARTRLMPGGRVAIVQTRWHLDDLTGRVVRDMTQNEKTDQFEIVEFPAILSLLDRDGNKVEKPLWPEFFDLEALIRIREGMPLFQWNAQYQQDPTSEEGSIVKREWWRIWKKERPPKCEFIIMALDSAAELKNRNDFSALTTWGVFDNEENSRYEVILLNSIKERYEFPELKDKMVAEYHEWEPDSFIVEKKSSGVALYQEMRRMGLPVQEFTPHRGTGDKLARLNAVADIIRSGMVWVPETRWAEELVEEVASFPFGSNDDLVDSMTMAMQRFRNGGFIRLDSDVQDEPQLHRRRAGGYY